MNNEELIQAYDDLEIKYLGWSEDHPKIKAELLSRLNEAERLREIAQWFCDRVEKGEVRSKKTYTRFKQALTTPEPLKAK